MSKKIASVPIGLLSIIKEQKEMAFYIKKRDFNYRYISNKTL